MFKPSGSLEVGSSLGSLSVWFVERVLSGEAVREGGEQEEQNLGQEVTSGEAKPI